LERYASRAGLGARARFHRESDGAGEMSASSIDVSAVRDWLVNGAPGARGAPDVVKRICDDLVRAGIPLDRTESFVRTLHPHIVGRPFVWRPDVAVEVREQSWAYLLSPEFSCSPIGA